MKKTRIRIVDISLFFVQLFILYIFWYFGAFTPNNTILYGTSIAASLFVVIDLLYSHKSITLGLRSIVSLLICYSLYSFVSGLLISKNFNQIITSLITFVAYTIVCYDITYISYRKMKSEWILNTFFVAAMLCSIQVLFAGVTVRSSTEYVTTMSAHNNPNSLGIVMVVGVFSAFKSKTINRFFLMDMIFTLLFIYVTIGCGSRKSFIAIIVIFALSLFNYMKNNHANYLNSRNILFRNISIIILVLIGSRILFNYFTSTSIIVRMVRMFSSDQGNSERITLIKEGIQFWKEHPVFGLGFDQFKLNSFNGAMSHSTYVEILSCSGVLGVFLWIFYLFRKAKSVYKNWQTAKKNKNLYEISLIVSMILVELFLGLGQVWLYDFIHLSCLTYLTLNSNYDVLK